MSIWFTQATIEGVNEMAKGTMDEHLGIEFQEIGEDFLKARMPVDKRTFQPFGILHGGASATLAESLGSVGANLCVDPREKRCVGVEINANHVRSVRSGYVYGTARPIHIGSSTQVWEISIMNEQNQLTCISRLTLVVLNAHE